MIDALGNIIGHIISILATIGAVAGELIIFIPFVLLIALWILVGNYREELSFRRLHFSRIREIDGLGSQKYFLFIRAFLGFMGFDEDNIQKEEDKEDTTGRGYNSRNPPGGFHEGLQRAGIGVPFVLVKEDVRYGVLLERRGLGLGRLAFNRLEKAMGEHDCMEGIILNNGYFSEADLAEGEARKIKMWDREWLIRSLLEMQGHEDTKGKDFKYYFHDFWRWALRN